MSSKCKVKKGGGVDDTPGCVAIPYFFYFVKRFNETFFKKFFKKVLQLSFFYAIISM